MTRFFDQKKIITILFISAVSILFINFLLDKFFLKNHNDENIEISSAEIDSTFRTALSNVGISNDWIKKQKGVEPLNFTVKIPNDLPIVVVLQELNNVFDTNLVKIIAVEKKN